MEKPARDFAITHPTSGVDDALEALRESLEHRWWKRWASVAGNGLFIGILLSVLTSPTRSPHENFYLLLGLSLWLGLTIASQGGKRDKELQLLISCLIQIRAEMKAKN